MTQGVLKIITGIQEQRLLDLTENNVSPCKNWVSKAVHWMRDQYVSYNRVKTPD